MKCIVFCELPVFVGVVLCRVVVVVVGPAVVMVVVVECSVVVEPETKMAFSQRTQIVLVTQSHIFLMERNIRSINIYSTNKFLFLTFYKHINIYTCKNSG